MDVTTLGPVFGVAAIAFAIFAYRKNRKVKTIEYNVTTNQALIDFGSSKAWKGLNISYGTNELLAPRVITVTFRNSGNVELRPEDYPTEGFGARLGGNQIRVISAHIVHWPTTVSGGRTVQPLQQFLNGASIPELALNPGGSLELRFLVDGRTNEIRDFGFLKGFSVGPKPLIPPLQAWRRRLVNAGWVVIGGFVLIVVAMSIFDAIVERGPARVPAVVGLTEKAAEQKLRAANLNGNIFVDITPGFRPVNDVSGLHVTGIAPRVGAEVDKDTKITLYVGRQ